MVLGEFCLARRVLRKAPASGPSRLDRAISPVFAATIRIQRLCAELNTSGFGSEALETKMPPSAGRRFGISSFKSNRSEFIWTGGDLLSHDLSRSTIGAVVLNCRVRDGIGCFTHAVTTRPDKPFGVQVSYCS